MRIPRIIVALWVLAFAPAMALAGKDQLAQTARRVVAEELRRHVVVLGGEALRGRAPGTRGSSMAAAYISAELAEAGVLPLGERGSFRQQVPLLATSPSPGCLLRLKSFGEERELRLWDDYLLRTFGAQTWLPRFTPLVFVGYGIVAPEFDYSDYHDVDVAGKVVVYLAGEPLSTDPEYFLGDRPTVHSSFESKLRTALSRGAVGSVLIPALGADTALAWSRLRREYSFEHVSLASAPPQHLSLIIHPRLAQAVFSESLYDYDRVLEMHREHALRSFHLRTSLSFEGEFSERSFLAANLVGLIEGREAGARDSSVVLSAHYDHLGVGPEVDGDSVYNGVVDNAMGVAAVLEMARVIAEMPEKPRRSVIFLLTTAEEKGLLGARYFLDHPPVPRSAMVANVNVDGLAFLDTFDDLVGVGAELSDLSWMLKKAAAAIGLTVGTPPKEVWSREAFIRSDQVAFAEAGIPAVLVNEGFSWHHHSPEEAIVESVRWFETHYHMPSDDLEQKIQWDASRLHCAAVLSFLLTVADSAVAPEWRPGVPYAYERLLSLAEERR